MDYKSIWTAGLGGVVTAAILYSANLLTGVPTILIPTGAVVAFNSARSPDGWIDFSESWGRVIVGVGDGQTLKRRTLLEQGGKENDYITYKQTLAHHLEYSIEYWDNRNNVRYATIDGNANDKIIIKQTRNEYEKRAAEA